MRLLVLEDDARMAAALARGLRRAGAAVEVVGDGAAALYHARVHPYDIVVLDRDLPKLHRDDVCRTRNQERPEVKILMVTAAHTVDDVVAGSRSAPTTTSPSRSASPSWRRASVRWPAAPRRRSSECGGRCSPRAAPWSARRTCWSACGRRTPTRSPTPCA